MSETLNKRILAKLDQSECHEIVREFLRDLLFFELQNLEYAKPAYSKYYDSRIESAAKEYHKIRVESENEN
ncbi:MAG: hypothetical protein ACTSUC_03990 [Promethearchaeota archaeon]